MNKAMLTREQKNEKYKHTSLEMETSTHFPILMRLVNHTEGEGTIMEVGSGMFSTPLLHWMCFENKRKLITVERHLHYYDFAKKFRSDSHLVLPIKNIQDEQFNEHFSIVFIDHSPKKPRTRGDDALLFKDCADYIILHDCGPDPKEKYGYTQLFSQFKYIYHYIKTGAHTTVLSNFKDLNFLDQEPLPF